MTPSRTVSIIQAVFLAIGAAMLAGCAFWFVHEQRFLASAQRVEGTVTDLERHRSSSDHSSTWAPVVSYVTPDGRTREFVSSSSSNPPSYRRGERVQVLFDPNDPDHAAIEGFFSQWGGIVIVGGLGAVFFLIGGGMWLARRRRTARQAELRSRGRRIEARITSVELNEGFSVNGRHPYRILCQWQDPSTGRMHVFASDNIWYDPSEALDRDTATVFVDPADPGRYWVDTSFLPKLA